MSKKLLYIIIAVLIIFLAASLYFGRNLYYAANRIVGAQKTVSELIQKEQVHEGDIIFQTSRSRQSMAIEAATHSQLSHCGLIFKDHEGYYVLEATGPVKKTPLANWISKGRQN